MIIRNPIKMSFAQRSLAAIRQHEQTKKRRRAIFGIQFANVAVYAAVFLLVISMIYIGYGQPQKTTAVNNIAPTTSTDAANQPSVDDAVAASVAAGVAQTINLPVVDSVSNLAVTVRVQSELVNSETASAVKPQIIESVVENKKVKNYTAAEGDTVSFLAAKFGVSEQTIRWANDLKESDIISVGDILKILPVNGVLYTAKTTDTVDSIAERYKVDKTRFVTYNDLEVSGLIANNNIILPDGVLPETERPGYVAPVAYQIAYGFSGGAARFISLPWENSYYYYVNNEVKSYLPHISDLQQKSNGNTMALGNCTWWAWERRIALGKSLPYGANLGNAGSWASVLVSSFGYTVDKNPEVGDVFESWGHVGIVEAVNRDEMGNPVSLTTSEMNWNYRNYTVFSRTIPASNISDFNYIH